MLEAFHTKISSQLYYGIEVTSFKDGELVFNLAALKAFKGELNLESFRDEKNYKVDNKKTINACLVVNTEQVLSRVSTQPSGNVEQNIDQLFPNLEVNQFYYQSHDYQGQKFISISRKSHIDAIVEALEKLSIYVNDICLGNTIVSVLDKFSTLKSLTTSNASIYIENGLSVKKQNDLTTETYTIEGIDVPNLHVLSFLGAVHQNLSLFDSENNLSDIVKSSHDEYKQYLIFYYGIRSAVAILLLALMVNFYYFNSYYDYVSNNPNVENESLKTTFANLKAEVDQQDKLINQILQNQSSSTSQIINDVIKTLPANIELSVIAFQALRKSIKKGKPIELNLGEVIIKGDTRENESFATWNTALENLNWVKNVTITKFDAIENSDKHQFELKIQMDQ